MYIIYMIEIIVVIFLYFNCNLNGKILTLKTTKGQVCILYLSEKILKIIKRKKHKVIIELYKTVYNQKEDRKMGKE